ncbi:amino acid adenylation domain-containing protein, partial [Paenibacillus sp. SI8]|uniref:amino acid adenylation domain-containing protein n=1 Tax=Paenibacillus sp. SI8 TaxID=3163026 RepID=UPI003466AF01
MKKQRVFWNDRFDAEDTISILPYKTAVKNREAQSQAAHTKVVHVHLPTQVSQRLTSIANGSHLALFTLLLTGVHCLLYKYTNENKIILGIPAVRTANASLTNEIILLKNEMNGTESFKSLLSRVNATVGESIVNQNITLQKMAGALNLQYDPQGAPIIHTLVSFKEIHTLRNSESIVSEIEFAFELDNEDIRLTVLFKDDRYDQETVDQLISHLHLIYSLALFQPALEIDQIDIISEAEKARLLFEFNDTARDYPREKTIYGLFEEQAKRTPDRVAVRFEDEQLTYRELNAQANRLARTLRAEGVLPDDKVGIMVERSLEMIVGIYAILKAGGAYVPIDPAYPAERISFILEDSGAKLLLTQQHLGDRMPAELSSKVIDLNDSALYAEDGSNLEPLAGPRDVAYVIYTSGSTGKPKGVMIEHHSVINRILWMHERYPIGETDVILQKTAFTFDVSVWELFWWAMVGSSVCMLSVGGEKSPERMLATIERSGVTTMHFVPAMLHALLDYAEQQPSSKLAEQLGSLRQVFASGEALPPQHVARFQQAVAAINRARLINLYGPTEATVDVSYFDCEPDAVYPVIPIGKPIHNTRLYIVKEGTQQLQPIGVAGELCIAGVGVAKGYLNRPELTAEKFTDDPFADGQRMYRTGDLARWLPDGNIEYLGRIDHQVKIRGYRIELGEVESQLLNVEAVLEAVVVAREDENGQKLLCAYYVAEIDLTAGELRGRLSETLPSYMVPTYLVQLERMPLSPNGKIDRKALPAPEGSVQAGMAYVAPRTLVETKLAQIWQDVLGLERVGVMDNFFDIGGHSLRAATLVARIHKEMDKQLELREVFQALTIEHMAQVIEHKETQVLASIPSAQENEYYPVSSAQKRVYILSNLEGGELGYNMPGVVQAQGSLDRNRLEEAFRKLIARHESLRTSFELANGEPVQRIHREVSFAIDVIHADSEHTELSIRRFMRPFDLGQAPLLRAGLIEQAPNRHLLLIDMHHTISDGASLTVFISELARLYNGEELPELRIQYKDYAVWQHTGIQNKKWKKQESFWLERFQGEIPTLDLRADYVRPAVQSFEGDKIAFAINRSTTEALQKLASRSGSTLYMVLLAAYTALLYKYTGQEDVIVGTPVAGRPHADLAPIIGMFVNTLAIRSYPAGEKTFIDYLTEVKEHALSALEHQDYPFEELVSKLNVKRDMSRNPLFDTMFELKNLERAEANLEDVSFTEYPGEETVAKFDLTLEAVFEEEGILFSLEYATAIYKRETAEQWARHFGQVLEAVVHDPQIKLSALEIITNEEKSQLLETFSGRGAEGQEHLLEKPFHVYVEEQVQR